AAREPCGAACRGEGEGPGWLDGPHWLTRHNRTGPPGTSARCVSGEIRINRLNLGRYHLFPVRKVTDCYAHKLRGGLRTSFVSKRSHSVTLTIRGLSHGVASPVHPHADLSARPDPGAVADRAVRVRHVPHRPGGAEPGPGEHDQVGHRRAHRRVPEPGRRRAATRAGLPVRPDGGEPGRPPGTA